MTVFGNAFVVEAIDHCNFARFVISTEKGDVIGISQQVAEQKSAGFETVVATVNVVAHEDVLGTGERTACEVD